MTQNFKNAKIYKISNDYNDDIYVGSTCNTLTKRYSLHKCHATTQDHQHKPLYKLINEIGFERFRIQLIEECPCEDRYQLRQKEGQYIREMGTLNLRIAGENKEDRKQKKHLFYQSNKEKYKEKKKIFIENNKDYYNEKQKQYNEDRNQKTFQCECGCVVKRMIPHLKSEKHKKKMNKISI